MALFQELNDQGITVVLVTHEPDIADYAKRIVQMRDGRIFSDEPVADRARRRPGPRESWTGGGMNLQILIRLAMQSILKNRMRSALTMLGIIIGVAAVIVMVAVGHGARSRIREQISNLGTNMIVITPGASTTGGVSQGAQAFATLTIADAEKIRSQSQTVVGRVARHRPAQPGHRAGGNWRTSINGVDPDYQTIRDWQTDRARSSGPRTCARRAGWRCWARRSRSASSPAAIPSGRRSRSRRCASS